MPSWNVRYHKKRKNYVPGPRHDWCDVMQSAQDVFFFFNREFCFSRSEPLHHRPPAPAEKDERRRSQA